jgi:hypothetical protein
MLPPDEVRGVEAWRVYDAMNPKVPTDIAESATTECWAYDQLEMTGRWRPGDKACFGNHVWECRKSSIPFCDMYKAETSLGYLGWKMLPFYAKQTKFDGSADIDPEQVVDKPVPGSDADAKVHNKAYREPSIFDVMALFKDKEINKDYELLDSINDGVFVLQTSL